MAETVSKVMNLLPEYQEKFLKDLLANIYQTDEESGTITGIAAQSPLYGQPVMDPATGEQMYEAADGTYTSDPAMAVTDQYGEPIFAVEGGVAAPDVIGFTDPQTQAIARLTGGVDPVTGEQYESMMGAYQPYLDRAEQVFETGVTSLEDSQGLYDPQSYKEYYDPFVEDVIETSQADIAEALTRERSRIGAEAGARGAFGSRRDLMEGEAIGRSAAEEGKLGAQLRSAAYTGAQQQAQSAFENQQKRGQTAAQLFQGLGTGIGALGEAAQSQGFQDVNTLFNTGALEQRQLQSEYDVQRAGQLEEAYEPFARFSYMRDILSGVPSSGTSLSAAATPQASFLGGALSTANSIYGAQGGSQPILGGLGSLRNVSGA
jgi:hypothetical protein